MPMELQVIRASEFVRWDAHKHLNFEASKQALRELAVASRKRGLSCAMVDLRPVPSAPKPIFTPDELAALVRTFREAGFTRDQRLAVLYDEDPFGGVRNFAFFGRLRGLQVQAFTRFEPALSWLSELPESWTESSRGEVPIPVIRRAGRAKNPRSLLKRAPKKA